MSPQEAAVAARKREEQARYAAIGGGAVVLGGLVVWTLNQMNEYGRKRRQR